jgi:hypothetical protein
VSDEPYKRAEGIHLLNRDNYAEAGNWVGWRYPVAYGKDSGVAVDVLVLGGGIAGCCAAMNVAKKGLSVAFIEKGATIRSDGEGSGCDHWLYIPNLCSEVTAEEWAGVESESRGGCVNSMK